MKREDAEKLVDSLIEWGSIIEANGSGFRPELEELKKKAITALCQPDHSSEANEMINFEFWMAVNKEGRPIHSTINSLKECTDAHARFIYLEDYRVLGFRAVEVKS